MSVDAVSQVLFKKYVPLCLNSRNTYVRETLIKKLLELKHRESTDRDLFSAKKSELNELKTEIEESNYRLTKLIAQHCDLENRARELDREKCDLEGLQKELDFELGVALERQGAYEQTERELQRAIAVAEEALPNYLRQMEDLHDCIRKTLDALAMLDATSANHREARFSVVQESQEIERQRLALMQRTDEVVDQMAPLRNAIIDAERELADNKSRIEGVNREVQRMTTLIEEAAVLKQSNCEKISKHRFEIEWEKGSLKDMEDKVQSTAKLLTEKLGVVKQLEQKRNEFFRLSPMLTEVDEDIQGIVDRNQAIREKIQFVVNERSDLSDKAEKKEADLKRCSVVLNRLEKLQVESQKSMQGLELERQELEDSLLSLSEAVRLQKQELSSRKKERSDKRRGQIKAQKDLLEKAVIERLTKRLLENYSSELIQIEKQLEKSLADEKSTCLHEMETVMRSIALNTHEEYLKIVGANSFNRVNFSDSIIRPINSEKS